QRFDGDLAGELLVKFERVFDDNAADARFEQRLQRQPAAAVGQRHDDAERLDALDDFRELLDGAEPRHAIRGVWFFLIDHAGDAPRLVGRIHFVYQLRGHRTVAENHYGFHGVPLFDGDAFGEIARLVDVCAGQHSHVVREQLQRDGGEKWLEPVRRARNRNLNVGEVIRGLVAFSDDGHHET